MSLSMKFPLNPNGESNAGFDSFTDAELTHAIKQNMKMLFLTIKGEYVWDSDFGIGLYGYLFENDVTIQVEALKGEVLNQISRYMPYVNVEDLQVIVDSDRQALKVKLSFYYNGLSIPELFEVEVSQ